MTLLTVEEATPTVEIWWGLGAMAIGSICLLALRHGLYERLSWAVFRGTASKRITVWTVRILVATGFVVFVQGVVLGALN
jgi:hypothetical protein